MSNIESSAAMRFLLEDVREFHEAMSIDCAPCPWVNPDPDLVRLRAKLIIEESMETVAGMLNVGDPAAVKASIAEACADVDQEGVRFDIEQVADGLADLIYVCVGAALSFGIPLERVWAEVCRANNAKVGGPKREDGKQLKPPGWVGPRVREALFGDAETAAE